MLNKIVAKYSAGVQNVVPVVTEDGHSEGGVSERGHDGGGDDDDK